jgi:hypothetical protein
MVASVSGCGCGLEDPDATEDIRSYCRAFANIAIVHGTAFILDRYSPSRCSDRSDGYRTQAGFGDPQPKGL